MRALVLSGGGAKGQYHVGALQYLLGDLGIQYDLICGVSVGALIAAYLCQFPHGQEKQASEGLTALFSSIENKDVWAHWKPFRYLHGLWRGGIMDSRPLKQTIIKHLDVEKIRSSGKKLVFSATSLTTGTALLFTQNDEPLTDLIYASAAVPVAFEPVLVNGFWLSDASVHTVTPITPAVQAGADIIDVILADPESAQPKFKARNALSVAFRAIELMGFRIKYDDLNYALLYNRLVKAERNKDQCIKFNVIKPDSVLCDDLLNFNTDEAKEMQATGYRDAKKIFTDL